MKKITTGTLNSWSRYLVEEEKATATINKYLRDVRDFALWLGEGRLCKTAVLSYKTHLCESYATASVNAALSSLNAFFRFLGWHELRVKSIKMQKQIFASSDKEISESEYDKLLEAARLRRNERLCLLMQTICSTGIRVSELRYITVEAVELGIAVINCKGKQRKVFLPSQLCIMLRSYAEERAIKSGSVFITKSGKPLDRSNVWSDMKKLCISAGVSEQKVFPHNLRHLFARTYYSLQKDVVRLADILGHSNVNTTRIYTMESGDMLRDQIQMLGLVRF